MTPEKAEAGLTRLRVELLPLDLGPQTFLLAWSLVKAGKTETVLTPVVLNVEDPPKASAELRDIKPPLAARGPLWPWLLAAAALAAAAWLLSRRKPSAARPTAAEPVDERPAEAIAEAALADLEASGLWAQGLHKEHALRLTEILRRYLEARFPLPATRLTTSELHRGLRTLELDRAVVALFKSLFDRADLVKFAKVQAEPQWGALDFEEARRLIKGTPPPSTAETGVR